MSKVLLVLVVVAVLAVASAVSAKPPPSEPQVHWIDVASEVSFEKIDPPAEGYGRWLTFTFTTPKKGSALADYEVNPYVAIDPTPSPIDKLTIDTQLVDDNWVTVVRFSVESPYTRNTEFTVYYGIAQAAGKSNQQFIGITQATAKAADFL